MADMTLEEALQWADENGCLYQNPCDKGWEQDNALALTALAAEVRRLQTIVQLQGEYGADDKAMYNDPRYPHDTPPTPPQEG